MSKWFDSGRLKGYRIPGSQDRRIPREYLIKFLKEHGMPLGDLEDEAMAKVLIVAQDQVLIENLKRELPPEKAFKVGTAASGFEGDVISHGSANDSEGDVINHGAANDFEGDLIDHFAASGSEGDVIDLGDANDFNIDSRLCMTTLWPRQTVVMCPSMRTPRLCRQWSRAEVI